MLSRQKRLSLFIQSKLLQVVTFRKLIVTLWQVFTPQNFFQKRLLIAVNQSATIWGLQKHNEFFSNLVPTKMIRKHAHNLNYEKIKEGNVGFLYFMIERTSTLNIVKHKLLALSSNRSSWKTFAQFEVRQDQGWNL